MIQPYSRPEKLEMRCMLTSALVVLFVRLISSFPQPAGVGTFRMSGLSLKKMSLG